MARTNHTQRLARTEEALTVLFCLIDDAYVLLNPHGARCYESIKRLSDSEVIALALFQQLRGVESERSFLRDAERFFSHLFPGVVGLAPSSFHRRVRKLRRFLEPLRRAVVGDLLGDPETLLGDPVGRPCWETLLGDPVGRPCWSTPPCLPRCTRGRSPSPPVSRERGGLGGVPLASTG
jgi:hypothetical protein